MNYLMDFSGDTTPQVHGLRAQAARRTPTPNSPLLPKAAVYLVNHRDEGYYWDSTEQTAMVIYGLTDYLERTQELKPNYSVDVQVNGKTVATKKFTAADALAPATTVTLNESQLAPGNNQVRIAEDRRRPRVLVDARRVLLQRGEGGEHRQLQAERRAGILQADLTAAGRTRSCITSISSPARSQVGDTLAVRITVGGNDWKYLMIEDPIPSGTESIARDDLYELDEKPDWWGRWASYRELRDDRTTFFNLNFPQGQHEYVYLLKVVNPGVFRVSPTQRGTDVSARVSRNQRRGDGDGEMTTQANRGGVAKLWLLNFVGNAAAAGGRRTSGCWLPDAHGWQVAGSAAGGGLHHRAGCVAARGDVCVLPGCRVSRDGSGMASLSPFAAAHRRAGDL